MSNNRRHLVSRARLNNGASQSPAPSSQSRTAQALTQLNTELPPYQPPECQLTASQKQALSSLKTNHDYRKYQKHLKAAMGTVTDAASSANDRLYERNMEIEKAAERRRNQGKTEDDMTAEEIEQRRNHVVFTKKVGEITKDAEKALRELIDFDDEQKMHAHHIGQVHEAIADAAPPRHRGGGEEEEDNVEIISATELFKKTKADYMAGYTSKSMMDRYGDHNEYKNFKRVLHDAMNPGDDAPELPRANTWFPDDNSKSGSRRRQGNTTDHTSNGYDTDSSGSIIIERATQNLKCPLSIQYFEEPITSTCNHTFNKEHFEEYFKNTVGDRGPRGKTVKCPTTGCNQDLTMDDFHFDKVKLRQVERKKKEEARANEDSDEEAPRGGQSRPQELGDDDDDEDEDNEDAAIQAHRSRVKSERAKSRGLNSNLPKPGGGISSDSDEEMEG